MGDVLKDIAGTTWKLGGVPVTAAGTVAGGGMDLVGDAAKDAAADAIQGKAEEFLWDLAQSVVDGTQVLFHLTVGLLLQMTEPQVTGEFIYTMGGRIFFISLPLIVAFAAIRIIAASLRAQALTGARDAFLGAGVSVLGTVALVPLTAIAVRAVDAVANGMLRATLSDGDEFVNEIMEAVVQLGTMVGNMVAGEEISGPVQAWQVPAGGVITTALICMAAAGLLLLASLVIGLALVARNMLLYIVIVVGPLCLSGIAWAPTRRWASIWLGWMVALIFTKLAIVIVMGLGVLAVTSTIQSGEVTSDPLPGLTTVLSGIMMLILAAFMPVACFALFGWMGEAGVRELQGAANGAQGMLTSAPAAALSASQSAGGRLSSLLEGNGSGKGGDAGLAGGDSGGGDVATEAATTTQTGANADAAVGTTAATGGLAAPAVVAAEAANEVKETAQEVADDVKDNIDGAVSETTETGGDGSANVPSGGTGDGGEQPYFGEQTAPGEGTEGGGSTAPVVADEPMGGEGPAPTEPAPGDSPPPASQPPLSEPAPEPTVNEAPPAPVSAPLDVPVTDENSEGEK